MENSDVSVSRPPLDGRARRRLSLEDRREELVVAALTVLRGDQHDAERVNWVALVTAEAGAAKGTFYRYFPSWEDMLATVRDRLLDDFHAPVLSALETPEEPDWWSVIKRQCDRLVDVALAYRAHHGLIFHSPLPTRPADPMATGSAVLTRAIRRGVAAGRFQPVPEPEITAALLFTGMHAVADAVLAGADRDRWRAVWVKQTAAILLPEVSRSSEAGHEGGETHER